MKTITTQGYLSIKCNKRCNTRYHHANQINHMKLTAFHKQNTLFPKKLMILHPITKILVNEGILQQN